MNTIAAREALTAHGIGPTARILSVTRIDTALIVVTHDADATHPYAVDTFRLPTAAETDPELVDPRTPGQWILIEEQADDTPDAISRMVAATTAYLAELGITAETETALAA